jgi:tRNA-2-methylthio-N6-dimethylallyladenosine synthase
MDYMLKVKKLNENLNLRAYILTFGCQQNEADSEKLSGMAEAMGYGIVDKPDDADLIVVNTCAIREHAEQKALSTIGQFKHLKNKKPSLVIAVCGCMVAQEHRQNDIKFKYPYVNFIFGTTALHKFPELLYKNLTEKKRLYYNEEASRTIAEGIPIKRDNDYKAWVSVMYGCNNFCSYCIVPYVRGRERSRCPEDICAEVKELIDKGYKDITLLGQNVNSYGKDGDFDCDFADLLDKLASFEGDYILRFMTSHPKDATHKLIDVMAKHDRIAKHFHLPMQAGSDTVLKRMNRRYDTEKYYGTVEYIREKMPECVITSDIIVGFPGETEDDFEGTLRMLEKVEFDMLYSFIYSPRKGTPAAEMEDQIPREVQNARFDRLLATQNEIALKKNLPMVGKTVRVLCDGESKTNSDTYSGRTEGNKIVFFEGDPSDRGTFVNIKIDRAEAFALYGEKVK